MRAASPRFPEHGQNGRQYVPQQELQRATGVPVGRLLRSVADEEDSEADLLFRRHLYCEFAAQLIERGRQDASEHRNCANFSPSAVPVWLG